MPLSKRHLDLNSEPVSFDPDELADKLRVGCPDILFAILLGSSADGIVSAHSDLDLALFCRKPVGLELFRKVSMICEELVPGVRCDIGCLNSAEPVYGFEALKGKLLFTRDREAWLRFYSLTCRKYESQLVHYQRQHRYRLACNV